MTQIWPGLHAPRDFAIGNDLWSPYPSSCAKKWLSMFHCDSSWFISVYAWWVVGCFGSSSLPISSNLAQERCCVRLWKCSKNYPLILVVKCPWDRASDSNFPDARVIFMKSRRCIPGLQLYLGIHGRIITTFCGHLFYGCRCFNEFPSFWNFEAPAFAFATFPGRAATRPPPPNRSGEPFKRGRIWI